jgi:hypothetical protein
MYETGELSLQMKGALKDLIVDQDSTILAVAEQYDGDDELAEVCLSVLFLAFSRTFCLPSVQRLALALGQPLLREIFTLIIINYRPSSVQHSFFPCAA